MLTRFIAWLQGLPPELLWAMMLVVCFGSVLAMALLAGLLVYFLLAPVGP